MDKYGCNAKIKSNSQSWRREGRFSVHDNKDVGILKVIMRNLTKEDEGKYWCAVDLKMNFDKYTEVNLKVKEGKAIDIELLKNGNTQV